MQSELFSCADCSPVPVESGVVQHTLDPESKISLGNLTPERLSPNMFIGINIDPMIEMNERNNIAIEWSNFTSNSSIASASQYHKLTPVTSAMTDLLPQMISTSINDHTVCSSAVPVTSHQLIDINSCMNLDHSSPYDEMRYLNVDNFSIESFKNDCIELNMDQTIVLNDKSMAITNALLEAGAHDELDMQASFSMEDKSSPLLDLENPVMNIQVDGMQLQ